MGPGALYAPAMDQDPVARLSLAISHIFAQGLPQGPEVLQYMRSCFGVHGAQDLAKLLTDREASETASLAELLLSPGQETFLALEPILADCPCSPDQVRTVARAVAQDTQATSVILPGPERVPVAVTSAEIESFVARLGLDRTIPEELAQVLDEPERFPRDLALAARVRLRHCQLAWSGARVAFLAGLLRRLEQGAPRVLEMLDWALSFLGGQEAWFDPVRALGRRHEELSCLLTRSVELQASLARGNYETLIMQGGRVALPHPEALIREMDLLDQASLLVLGRPAEALAGVIEEDLGSHQDPESLLQALGLGRS